MHLSVYLPIQCDGRGQWISHLWSLLAVLILDPLPKVLIHRSGVGSACHTGCPSDADEVVLRPLSGSTGLVPHLVLP